MMWMETAVLTALAADIGADELDAPPFEPTNWVICP